MEKKIDEDTAIIEIKGNICLFLFKRYLRNLLVGLDQFVNVITFGDEDETISSRLGKSQRGDFGVLHKELTRPLAIFVDFVAAKVFKDYNHCEKNIEENVGHTALISIYRNYRAQKDKVKEDKQLIINPEDQYK